MKRKVHATTTSFNTVSNKKRKQIKYDKKKRFCLFYMHYLQLISYRSIHRNNVLREIALKRNP